MKNTKTKIMALAASAALVAMLGLAACGGSSSSSAASASSASASASSASAASSEAASSSAAATSASASSAAATSASASSAAESTSAAATSTSAAASTAAANGVVEVSEMDGYMGYTEAGESVFYAESSDGTEGCLVFLARDGSYVSFVGELTSPSETQVTVTDVQSGLAMTFEVVAADNDGGVVIDMGEELGKAVLVPADINEVLNAIATIDVYGNAVA